MANSDNSYTVTLQENVPLSEADKTLVNKMIKEQKVTFVFLIILVFFTAAIVPYLPFKLNIILQIYITINLLFGLITWKLIGNNRKDVRKGKSVLTGMLIYSIWHGRGYAYFHFVEPPKQPLIKTGVNETNNPRYQIIKIMVDKTDYMRYQVGAMLTVSFLPTSRVAIKIVAQ